MSYERLQARDGITLYCNGCLKRYAVVYEPGFSKDEDPQPMGQVPLICPFCAGEDIESSGDVIKDARILPESFLRSL